MENQKIPDLSRSTGPCCHELWRNRKNIVSLNSCHVSSVFAALHFFLMKCVAISQFAHLVFPAYAKDHHEFGISSTLFPMRCSKLRMKTRRRKPGYWLWQNTSSLNTSFYVMMPLIDRYVRWLGLLNESHVLIRPRWWCDCNFNNGNWWPFHKHQLLEWDLI